MGYHTRTHGAHELSNVPNQFGLLFWTIYFLEKHLSVRLGRCSIIADYEVTVPFTGDGPAMIYCGSWIKLARLASKAYESLYSAVALTLSDDIRRAKVSELSQELYNIQEESRDALVSHDAHSIHTEKCSDHSSYELAIVARVRCRRTSKRHHRLYPQI